MDSLFKWFVPIFWPNSTGDEFLDLDTSKIPFPNVLWHVRPAEEIVVKTMLMIPVGIIGIFLNYTILWVLIKNKWLWSASNILIANLALVDLITLVFCPWLMLIRDFHQNYVLGIFGCKFEGFLQASCLLAAVGAIMLVSYDRLAAATLTTEARITKKSAPRLIVMTWCLSIGLSIPWIIYRNYTERQWLDFLETFCVENVNILGVYWHVVITIVVWVPLGLMILTYGTIIWRLERSRKELASRGGGVSIARARRRAIRVTACVLVTATACRIPYTALLYWRNNLQGEVNAVDGSFDKFWFAAVYLMYFDCAINPLIYAFTNERYRRAMDKTPGISCFQFGSWCCTCQACKTKPVESLNKNDEIFIVGGSPKSNKRISQLIKNMLHIHKDTVQLSIPNIDESTKPTKITPLKGENIEQNI